MANDVRVLDVSEEDLEVLQSRVRQRSRLFVELFSLSAAA